MSLPLLPVFQVFINSKDVSYGEGEDKVGIVSYTSTRWGTLLSAPSGFATCR